MNEPAKRTGRVRTTWKRVVVLAAGLLTVMVAPPAGAAAKGPRVHTVASGLDNPRGLTFLPDGMLAVAEGGHAGPLCVAGCGGLTGKIVAVNPRTGHTTTLAAGFPSIGEPFAPFGLGGLAVKGGRLYAIVGENPQEFGDPAKACKGHRRFSACLATLRKIVSEVGNVVEVRSLRANRGWRTLARVGRYDFNYARTHRQPRTPPDGDPFGLITRPSGGFYVVDAASNTLDSVGARGGASVIQTVPAPPNHKPIPDAAPTCAARVPDGALVIGTESGMLLRWASGQMTPLLVGGKVQQVVGCVTDPQGNVYLANLDPSVKNFIGKPFTGSVVKVTPTLRTTYIARGLNYPTGITLARDGDLYVTVNGLCPTNLSLLSAHSAPPHACPASGKVLRINRNG